jgi:hypothetical protein
VRPGDDGTAPPTPINFNAWPNPPYYNRPSGNKGNINENVILDTSQVQRPGFTAPKNRTNNTSRGNQYSRSFAIKQRARGKR